MDSESRQVPPVPARPSLRRQGWPNVVMVSTLLKILGLVGLLGSIAGGAYIASQIEPSWACNAVTFHCQWTDRRAWQTASVVGGVLGGLCTALLLWGVAFALDMLRRHGFRLAAVGPRSRRGGRIWCLKTRRPCKLG